MRRRWWILPLVSLAVLLTGIWGFSQYTARLQWENRIETQYQRAFADLTNNLGGLETQLAKASVSNSSHFLRQTLADIWRQAYASQEKIGQLPLGAVEMTRMKMLLAKVAAFAFRVIDKPMEDLHLTEADWTTLQGFRNQAKFVSGQLTSMQANILQNNLRWVDVDRLSGMRLTAAAIAERVETNKVTKSLVMMEDGLKRLPDPGFPESAVIFKPNPESLAGMEEISPDEGKKIAERFIGTGNTADYLGRMKGDIPTLLYSVTDRDKKEANPVRVSLTERGGLVAWMLAERPLGARRLGIDKATEIAKDFAKEKGLPDMAVVSREEFGTVDVITMVPNVGGVLLYPEMAKIQVAMDNGDVVGYEGLAYLTFHGGAQPKQGHLSQEEVKKLASPRLEVRQVHPAVILDNERKEVLCYEVDGTLKGERFLVYLDADRGTEIKIRRVDANGVEID